MTMRGVLTLYTTLGGYIWDENRYHSDRYVTASGYHSNMTGQLIATMAQVTYNSNRHKNNIKQDKTR